MKLRKYQVDICDEIQDRLLNFDTVVSSLAGGGGKSLVISELAKRYSSAWQSVCILTNITALIPQLSNHLNQMGIKHNVIKAGMSQEENDCLVHLIMEQSFHEDKRNELNLQCDILIKDEFHIGIGQKRFEAIRSHLNPSSIVGLTFTPLDELGYLLKGLEPNQVIGYGNANDLTEQGYLCPIKYFVPKWSEQVDYSNISSSGNDYNGQEIDKIVSQENHINLIIQSMDEMDARNKNVLVYASSIETAEIINSRLNDNGYESNVFHSKTDEKSSVVRLDALKSFERPSVIVSVMSLGIGFDAPKANLLVMLRPTKVKRLALQILARVSRLADGKDYAEVLDLAQCIRSHGFLTDEIELIRNGDKKALAEANNKTSLDVSVVLDKDDPTEITRELVLSRIEEIRNETRPRTMNEMIAIYEQSNSFDIIFELSMKMYDKVTGNATEPRTTTWIYNKWDEAFHEYPDFKDRWVRAYKTRAKNIIKSCMNGEPKKVASLAYFIDWLIEQKDVPYYG